MITSESVLGWLRSAYPQGIPREAYGALGLILRRTLGQQQADLIVTHLDTQGLHGTVDRTTMRSSGALDDVATVPDQDANGVAARLAAAGWPLLGLQESVDDTSRQGYLARIMNWLRAGYPQGVPPKDYMPILALLRRQLTEDEVDMIALRLISDAQAEGTIPSESDARSAIEETKDDVPTQEELDRVRTRLESHGWPFVEQ